MILIQDCINYQMPTMSNVKLSIKLSNCQIVTTSNVMYVDVCRLTLRIDCVLIFSIFCKKIFISNISCPMHKRTYFQNKRDLEYTKMCVALILLVSQTWFIKSWKENILPSFDLSVVGKGFFTKHLIIIIIPFSQ